MMNSQKMDVEKVSLIEDGKKQALIKLLGVMKLLITIQNDMYKIKSYCLNCKKDTENINPRVSNTSNGRTMILSKYAICESKKSRFIKDQEAKRLLSNTKRD